VDTTCLELNHSFLGYPLSVLLLSHVALEVEAAKENGEQRKEHHAAKQHQEKNDDLACNRRK
jgi:hypothetical protein